MNDLQKTFISMIKAALWDAEYECKDGISSADLFKEACRYEVAGILSPKLDLFCRDGNADIRNQWSKKAMIDYMKSLSTLTILESLNRILEPSGIRPVVIKGMAASYYYPNKMVRQFGDVDFIVPPERFEECLKILEKNGFLKTLDNKRHIELYKQKIDYEIHRYFSFNKTEQDKRIDRIIYEGCRNCISRKVEGRSFYALPEAENGIALLEHIKHHIPSGMGFRQILDWVVYADSVLDDDFWNNSFCGMVRECGLENLAKAVTRMAQLHLGLRTEGITWCCDGRDEICSALLEYLFTCNNFGFSNSAEDDVNKVARIFQLGFLKTLDTRAVMRFPIAEKVVLLRPIAWMYQIFKWVFLGTKMLVNRRKAVSHCYELHQTNQSLFSYIGL